MFSLLTGKVILALLTMVVLFSLGMKVPQAILAVYLNGLFIATLLLTDTGIPFFAGGSVLVVTAICLAFYLFKEVGLRAFLQRLKGFLPLLVLLIVVDLLIAYLYGTRSDYGFLKIVRFLSINVFLFFSIILFSGSKAKLHTFIKYTAGIGLVDCLAALFGLILEALIPCKAGITDLVFQAIGLTLLMFYYIGEMAKKNKYLFAASWLVLFRDECTWQPAGTGPGTFWGRFILFEFSILQLKSLKNGP